MQVDEMKDIKIRCWLEQTEPDTRPPIRHTSMGRGPGPCDCSIAFGRLTDEELKAFEAFENGASYIRVIGGRLHAFHAWEVLPDAEEDPLMGPHWGSGGEVKQFGGPPPGEGWHSPGIVITGLGAGTNEEGRKYSQDTLTECGFTCLRSPRENDGRYWEQWVLHFMLCAKGPLKGHMEKWRENNTTRNWWAEVEEAARFLTKVLHVRYGSLDITIQRWALCCTE